MYLHVYIPVDARWRRLMMTVVPSAGVMVIMMVIVGFITARQRKGDHKDEDPEADETLYLIFHPIKVWIANPKTLPRHYITNFVDISPQNTKNATKVV